MLEHALNTPDAVVLRNVIEKYFQTDCSVLSKCSDRLLGNHLIFQHYQPFMMWNCYFQFSPKENYSRLAVVEELCVGKLLPMSFQSENELWKLYFGNLNFDSEYEKQSCRGKYYQSMITNDNMPVTFHLKVNLYLVMNEDMSCIMHTMREVVSLDFFQDAFFSDIIN